MNMSPHLGKGDSKTYYRKIVSNNNDILVIPHTSFMILSKVLIISEPQIPQIWYGDDNRTYYLGFIFFRIKLENMSKALVTEPVTQ